MKRLIVAMVVLCLLLSGCGQPAPEESKQYTATYLTLFDTVTTMVGRAESQEAFQETAQAVHDALLEYHQLFDIYNDYPGIANLKTINDNAGIAPVKVDSRILALLKDCKSYYADTMGRVDVAMGSVLQLWHQARTDSLDDPSSAYLPEEGALKEAAKHMDLSAVVLDEEASTVFITDPMVRLDVGAVAKGWSLQRVCDNAPGNLLISVGGNVCAAGPKDDKGTPWVVGVQNPDQTQNYLHTLYIESGYSVVTSGDYQRNFQVDGKLYHHIIDPDTLYPSQYWRSVTIVCQDSGLADALSTALFLLPQQEGQQLLDAMGAEAMWVNAQGEMFYSPGFQQLIRT